MSQLWCDITKKLCVGTFFGSLSAVTVSHRSLSSSFNNLRCLFPCEQTNVNKRLNLSTAGLYQKGSNKRNNLSLVTSLETRGNPLLYVRFLYLYASAMCNHHRVKKQECALSLHNNRIHRTSFFDLVPIQCRSQTTQSCHALHFKSWPKGLLIFKCLYIINLCSGIYFWHHLVIYFPLCIYQKSLWQTTEAFQ